MPWCAKLLLSLALLGTSAVAHAEPAADHTVPRDASQVPDDVVPPEAQSPANAGASNKPPASRDARESICLMVEAAAMSHNLPVEFFARVIWQESRFQPDAVGPVTRSGARAQGIAQFMPGTAAERRLLDPFDPVQALPKSAEFLRELRDQFGNLGLAAAAYNAGPQRVRDFLSGARPLPAETRNYVLAITGSSADDWAKASKGAPAPASQPPVNCNAMIALLHRAPNPFVEKLEERITLVAAKPWGVQLAAGFSREHALSAYAGIARRYAGALSGQDPSLMGTTLRSRGTRTFYQVRVGADTRDAANRLCETIRRAGGACLVLRNGPALN
jgi:Transglycosylase SLT domain/SPOR domain